MRQGRLCTMSDLKLYQITRDDIPFTSASLSKAYVVPGT